MKILSFLIMIGFFLSAIIISRIHEARLNETNLEMWQAANQGVQDFYDKNGELQGKIYQVKDTPSIIRIKSVDKEKNTTTIVNTRTGKERTFNTFTYAALGDYLYFIVKTTIYVVNMGTGEVFEITAIPGSPLLVTGHILLVGRDENGKEHIDAYDVSNPKDIVKIN